MHMTEQHSKQTHGFTSALTQIRDFSAFNWTGWQSVL